MFIGHNIHIHIYHDQPCARTHACTRAHTHTHTHTHARTHAHTHTRTHACTHTHTRAPSLETLIYTIRLETTVKIIYNINLGSSLETY